jgi:hypothetical protein
MAVTPDGKTVYVACDTYPDSVVVPVSTASNTAGVPIPVGFYPVAIAVTGNGRDVIVANGTTLYRNGVHVISTSTNTVVKHFLITESPNSMTVAPDGRLAYLPGVGCAVLPRGGPIENLGIVTPIRLGRMTVAKPIVVGRDRGEGNYSPNRVAFAPDGRTAWVTYPGTNKVIEINAVSGRLVRSVRAGYDRDGLTVTPDGKWVYVTGASNNVAAIRTSTGKVTVIKAVPDSAASMYDGATGIAVAPDGRTVYVLNLRGHHPGSMTPIRVATNKPGKPIRVGFDPISIVIVP